MLKATFTVQGIADLMFGRAFREKKPDNLTHAQWEELTWQRKVPVTADGQVYINPFAVTNSLVTAAKWLGRKVDGKSGFAKRFQCGVTPGDKVLLYAANKEPLTINDIEPVFLFVPSDGKHGSGKRVERIFPTVHEWIGTGSVFIWDGKITAEQFRDHLEAVGKFIGWGSMRVENGGINGRFALLDCDFENIES